MADEIVISYGGRLDFTEKLGDTFSGQQYQFENADGGHTSLSSATIRSQIRLCDKEGSVKKTLTNGSGITVTDAVNAIIVMDPFDFDDSIFIASEYWYDIEVTYPDGTIKTWIEGVFNIIQDVTKDS
jgi:hypothetical protein